MIARLKDLSIDRAGGQNLTVHLNCDVSELFDSLHDFPVDIEIKKHHDKRSLDANALLWVMLDKLAAVAELPKVEVYRNIIRNIGGVSDTVCVPEKAAKKFCDEWNAKGLGWQTEVFPSKLKGCVNVTVYYGSSTYDTAQMSRLIDSVVDECEALGIPTEPKERIEDAKKKWGDK